MSKSLLFAALAMAFAGSVSADVVATCGASKGWAYYVPGPMVPEAESGWTEDGISKGGFQLIRSGDDFDIVYTDATGGTVSAKAEGGTIIGTMTNDGDVVVSVYYGVTWETYVFWLSPKKKMVSFSQAKFAALVQKHAVMVAPCRRGS